jgi:hypothetical protein
MGVASKEIKEFLLPITVCCDDTPPALAGSDA